MNQMLRSTHTHKKKKNKEIKKIKNAFFYFNNLCYYLLLFLSTCSKLRINFERSFQEEKIERVAEKVTILQINK